MAFQKGHQINKGRKFSDEHRRNMSISQKGKSHKKGWKVSKELLAKKSGENAYQWKGEKVGYTALHVWVAKRLGKPRYCANCQETNKKKYEWANISKTYRRDLSDWIRLCTSCHRLYDYGKISL